MSYFDFDKLDEKLKQKIQNTISVISADDLIFLTQNIKLTTLQKGENYIENNSTSYKIAYIAKGILRCVYLKNEEEITGAFFTEGSIVCSYNTLLFDKKCNYTVQAIEDTTVIEINNNTLRDLYLKNANLSEWGRDLLKMELGKVIERMESHFLDSPEERYIKLLKENREIFMRVPQKYIASYLGITAVSLSRIRARVLKKN